MSESEQVGERESYARRKKEGKKNRRVPRGFVYFLFLFFFFLCIHLTITHRSCCLQATSAGRRGERAGVDYEDVALFSDEKKYVALIKSDADGERNYGGCATTLRVHSGPRVFTEQPVFFFSSTFFLSLISVPLSVSLSPLPPPFGRAGSFLFLGSRARRDFEKIS